jgi:hypothetical protein
MVKPARADRRVALFEDGDLWHDEEASPPESPAGWYFRPHGASTVWVGPFPTADAASSAPSRGDPIEVARRCLEEWRRSQAEPPLAEIGRGDRRVLTLDESRKRPQRDEPTPSVCLSASLLFHKSVQGEPERAAEGREQMPAGAPPPCEEASMARQLTLDLGPASDAGISDETRRPPGRSRRTRHGKRSAAMQEVLPLGLGPQE